MKKKSNRTLEAFLDAGDAWSHGSVCRVQATAVSIELTTHALVLQKATANIQTLRCHYGNQSGPVPPAGVARHIQRRIQCIRIKQANADGPPSGHGELQAQRPRTSVELGQVACPVAPLANCEPAGQNSIEPTVRGPNLA